MITSERSLLIRSLHAAQELVIRKSRTDFKTFVKYTKPDYDMRWFHAYICEKLQEFADGKIKNMMILMPPQHGKSELASRLFPAYLLGLNPDRKIALTSYNHTMATGFNRAIQRNIDTLEYGKLFPETRLNFSRVFDTSYDNYTRTDSVFDIVQKTGSLRAIGRGGSLTGNPVDIGIIDDLYKDRDEAMSDKVSQSVWQWYVDVFLTRFHNTSQQLIMNTLWSENDLAVRIMKDQPGKWTIIKFPAIKTEDISDFDHRLPGEALWPEKHSLEKILEAKELDEVSFNSLQQQDPKPSTKLSVFPNWIEIPSWPDVDVRSWGLDFGKTTGINALIKHAVNGTNAYYEEGCYEPGLSTGAIKDLLIAAGYKEGQVVFCDHMPTKISEIRRLGIYAVPAIKGEGSIQAGITKLNEYKNHYTARSINLKSELGKYQYVTYGSLVTNIPVDAYNHAIDACRYANYSMSFQE